MSKTSVHSSYVWRVFTWKTDILWQRKAFTPFFIERVCWWKIERERRIPDVNEIRLTKWKRLIVSDISHFRHESAQSCKEQDRSGLNSCFNANACPRGDVFWKKCGRKIDKEMKEWEVWIQCVTRSQLAVLLISVSPSALFQQLSAHSIILCRARRLIYECSIGGLGHERLLDVHHTHHSHIHSLVIAMKGSFEKGCWADSTRLN